MKGKQMNLTVKEQIIIDFLTKEGYASITRILTQCNYISPEKITKVVLNSLVKKGILKESKDSVGIGSIGYSIIK